MSAGAGCWRAWRGARARRGHRGRVGWNQLPDRTLAWIAPRYAGRGTRGEHHGIHISSYASFSNKLLTRVVDACYTAVTMGNMQRGKRRRGFQRDPSSSRRATSDIDSTRRHAADGWPPWCGRGGGGAVLHGDRRGRGGPALVPPDRIGSLVDAGDFKAAESGITDALQAARAVVAATAGPTPSSASACAGSCSTSR